MMLVIASAATHARGQCAEPAKITASDAAANDWFGNVSSDGNSIVVGARQDDNATGVDAGAAYVYVKSGPPGSQVWTQQAKLIGDTQYDLELNSQSGVSVDVSGDTAMVGSWLWPNMGAQGAVYVFVRSGPPGSEVWTQQAVLGNFAFSSGYVYFGVSVALEGDAAVVGTLATPGLNAGGAAFFFARTSSNGVESWSNGQAVFPSDGVPGDQFGVSVAMSLTQDTAVIGAWLDDTTGGTDAGSAYVFIKSGNSWVEQAKLTASDSAALDQFGRQVAIDGNTIVVGSRQDDHPGKANAGSAYVFTRSGAIWTEQAKLTASDAAAGDEFGLALALSNNTVIIGAYSDDHAAGVDAGSAYVFTRTGTIWTEQFKLTAPDAAAGDAFGGSIALSNSTAVIGSVYDNLVGATDAGSAYVFDLGCGTLCCVGDFDCPVTLEDHNGFSACMSGPSSPSTTGCACSDVDADADVDLTDFADFANLFTG